MGIIDDIILGSQKYITAPEKKNVIYEDILNFCAPCTWVHGMKGDLGLGMADYTW
jgi:hypothetical protein